jgi:hypothetical protein
MMFVGMSLTLVASYLGWKSKKSVVEKESKEAVAA